MNPDHAHFAEWDAAYVVGALSSAERLRFEDHLAACPECRRAVAELSPTIGLLSRVSPERAASIDAALADGQVDQDGPDSSVRAEVVSLGERRALRRRRTWWLAAAAAVVLVVAAIVFGGLGNAHRPGLPVHPGIRRRGPCRGVAVRARRGGRRRRVDERLDVAGASRRDRASECGHGPEHRRDLRGRDPVGRFRPAAHEVRARRMRRPAGGVVIG